MSIDYVIPFKRQTIEKEDIDSVIENLTDKKNINNVFNFEKRFSDFSGFNYTVAVNNESSALHCAVNALGLSEGDEVIVPSLTFCASVQVITALGAKPVFCEVLTDTLCIDPDDIKHKISSKTKAIIPVHYCGIASQMDKIIEIAEKNNIVIIRIKGLWIYI